MINKEIKLKKKNQTIYDEFKAACQKLHIDSDKILIDAMQEVINISKDGEYQNILSTYINNFNEYIEEIKINYPIDTNVKKSIFEIIIRDLKKSLYTFMIESDHIRRFVSRKYQNDFDELIECLINIDLKILANDINDEQDLIDELVDGLYAITEKLKHDLT